MEHPNKRCSTILLASFITGFLLFLVQVECHLLLMQTFGTDISISAIFYIVLLSTAGFVLLLLSKSLSHTGWYQNLAIRHGAFACTCSFAVAGAAIAALTTESCILPYFGQRLLLVLCFFLFTFAIFLLFRYHSHADKCENPPRDLALEHVSSEEQAPAAIVTVRYTLSAAVVLIGLYQILQFTAQNPGILTASPGVAHSSFLLLSAVCIWLSMYTLKFSEKAIYLLAMSAPLYLYVLLPVLGHCFILLKGLFPATLTGYYLYSAAIFSSVFLFLFLPVLSVTTLVSLQYDMSGRSTVRSSIFFSVLTLAIALPTAFTIYGQKNITTSKDLLTLKLAGHLPALLSADSGRVAVMSSAANISAEALLLYPKISGIDIIQSEDQSLSSGSPEVEARAHVIRNNKTRVIPKEPYSFLLKAPEQYSLILLPPDFLPNGDSATYYSRDFYQRVRDALSPLGIFSFWLSQEPASQEQIRIMLSTLSDVFPEVRIFKAQKGAIVLASMLPIGARTLSSLSTSFSHTEIQKDLQHTGITSLQYLLGLEHWISPALYRGGEINTLNSPVLKPILHRDRYLDRQVPLQLTLTPPAEWYRNRQFANRSLLQIWLSETQEPLQIKELLRAGCGGIKINLIEPNWRYLRSVCREAAVAALLYRDVPAPDHLKTEIAWLQNFASDQPDYATGEKNTGDVLREIALFMQFDSPLVKLSPKKLLWRSSPCFRENSIDSLTCRDQLIKALIYTGHYEIAKNQLETFRRDADSILTQDKIKKLESLMDTAPELQGRSRRE